ncbi:MAG: hypothetical protein FJY75_11280, partial [Candidatus Eisenbacteria bacterium]|nr:hypothetical protein [Candidatus Eisenbacteria bacterium]
RHFLAPMQGGVFQDGQVTHHIGRAIFVFAGGTSYRMADFVRKSQEEGLRGAKLADFVSRLKGFYDALGPDPLDLLSPQGDPQHIVRRAVLLRSLLAANAPHLFDEGRGRGRLGIDPGALRAFLFVSRYRHGVRSMEAIIAMSILADRAGFERSSLPCVTQLDLHVDATEFLSLVQQPDFGKDIEKLAAAFHETYRRSQARKRPRPKYAAVAYARLPEAVRAENRANVLDIGRKLAACGCVMVPAAGAAPEARLTPEDFERMARMEHDRWVRSKLAQGWRWGEPRNDAARIHPALRPWERLTEGEKALMDPRLLALLGEGPLPEADREKDRKLVRGIPKILALAGYRILKIEPPREGSGRATNA